MRVYLLKARLMDPYGSSGRHDKQCTWKAQKMFIKNKVLAATVAAFAIAAPSLALAASNTRPIEGVISSPQPIGITTSYRATHSAPRSERAIANPAPKSGVAFSHSGATVDRSLNDSTKPYEGVISHPQPVGIAGTY